MQVVIKRRPVTVPILPIVTLILIIIGLFTMIRVSRIQADQIGVFVNNVTGDITVDTQPGANLYNGWLTDFYVLDNREQSYVMSRQEGGGSGEEVNIKTREGADIGLDVGINYRLVADASVIKEKVIPECGLNQLATRTGPLDAYKLKWIRDYSRSIIRYKFGELTPNSFYDASLREEKGREAKEELNRLLQPHGITVTLVSPQRFMFYRELEDMIQMKQEAEQEVEAEKAQAIAALQEQEREKTKATASLNVEVQKRDGELRKDILEAEAEAERGTKAAEAYAYRIKTEADAAFYKAQNDAKSMLARAEAEAEGLRKLAESLSGNGADNLVKMRYVDALRNARISGVPYATDPRIQKVEVSGAGTTPAAAGISTQGGGQ